MSAQLVGRSEAPDRDLYFAHLSDLDEWPDDLQAPKPHFVAFLAMDASSVESNRIAAFADRLISQGMVYLCAWGPDCERVHDIFDEAIGRNTTTDGAAFWTIWHDDEELVHALWFALFSTPPDDDADPSALLAVVVDHSEWSAQIRDALTDTNRFNTEVLEQEPER